MTPFDLFLFSTDTPFIREAVAAGVDGIVVDLERRGKELRQKGFDTQIGVDTLEDLIRVRVCTAARILCRTNSFGPGTQAEVELVIEAGADEVILPMVRRPQEVEAVLEYVGDRGRVGILVETTAATQYLPELSRLPLSRVYVGLNDLAIERGKRGIFGAVADGTVERIRESFRCAFGFGGLTLPDRGHPIPCRLLIGEMARLGCSFGLLRRSFHRDVRGRSLQEEIPRLKHAIELAFERSAAAIGEDRRSLEQAIHLATTSRAEGEPRLG